MRIALLGPLLVDGRPWAATSKAWRNIIAELAVEPGKTVPYETLAESGGIDKTSGRPTRAVQSCMSRLQRRLGLRVRSQEGIGYWLDAARGEVDVKLFEDQCAKGLRLAEAAVWNEARDALAPALRLYRDTPFSDIDCPRLENDWRPYLEGLWLQATKNLTRADLHLGHHESVIPGLESLTRRHPGEETFWAFLMLAQYRAGSSTAAKRTYQAADRILQADFDTAPGELLQTLHKQIRSGTPASTLDIP